MEVKGFKGLLVKETDTKSKCWVVRPGSRYAYIRQFTEQDFIATAHLDSFDFSQDSLNKLKDSEGGSVYPACNEIAENLTINIRSQVLSFVNEMKVGDVVFTLSSEFVYPGVVMSDAEICDDNISSSDAFKVRRKVVWGERILRSAVPVTLSKSFNAYQAVFSLGDNSKEIHHWLSSFFISEDNYFSSLSVRQKGSLSHHALKNLSELMDRLQVFALMVSEGKVDDKVLSLEQILAEMQEYAFDGRDLLALTSQQVLMSPGDIWYGFGTLSKKAGVTFLVGVALLFGQNICFADDELEAIRKDVSPLVEAHVGVLQEGTSLAHINKALWVDVSKQNKTFVSQADSDSRVFPEDGESRHSVR